MARSALDQQEVCAAGLSTSTSYYLMTIPSYMDNTMRDSITITLVSAAAIQPGCQLVYPLRLLPALRGRENLCTQGFSGLAISLVASRLLLLDHDLLSHLEDTPASSPVREGESGGLNTEIYISPRSRPQLFVTLLLHPKVSDIQTQYCHVQF